MSGINQICEKNPQRVMLAERHVDRPVAPARVPSRRAIRAWRQYKRMWAGAVASAATCGAGAAFLAIGINSMHLETIITGAVVVLTFLVSGARCEVAADNAVGEVIDHA